MMYNGNKQAWLKRRSDLPHLKTQRKNKCRSEEISQEMQRQCSKTCKINKDNRKEEIFFMTHISH